MKTSLSIQNPTGLIAYDHAPWLGMGQSHGHEGEDVQLHLQWWPHTPVDGLARDEKVSAYVVHQFGGREEIALAGYTADHSLRFKPPVSGLYHALRATEPGRCLVIARHQAPGDEEDVCDELSLTDTLAFMVTK